MDVPADIEKRFPQARGWGNKLAKPVRDVELLIGMDNQGWMPKHIGSSQVKADAILAGTGLHPDGKCQGKEFW
jgi:hypothetical protein